MDWSEEGLHDQRRGARRLAEGWRWAQDILENEIAVELSAFIERHGQTNVLLGPGISEDHAVYVRDLDDLLNELKEDILNFEMGHPIDD
jgi:hypothetical protein